MSHNQATTTACSSGSGSSGCRGSDGSSPLMQSMRRLLRSKVPLRRLYLLLLLLLRNRHVGKTESFLMGRVDDSVGAGE